MNWASDAAGRVATSVSGAAVNARRAVSGQAGRASDQVVEFVREQPFIALALTGLACFTLGILLGRR